MKHHGLRRDPLFWLVARRVRCSRDCSQWFVLFSIGFLALLILNWSSSFIELSFNIVSQLYGIQSRVVIFYHVAVGPNQELWKVPLELLGSLLLGVPKFRITSQISVDLMGILAIDTDFLEKRKLCSYLLSDNLIYDLVSIGLLAQEVVAGES